MAEKSEIQQLANRVVDSVAEAARAKVLSLLGSGALSLDDTNAEVMANAVAHAALLDAVDGYRPRTIEGRQISANLKRF